MAMPARTLGDHKEHLPDTHGAQSRRHCFAPKVGWILHEHYLQHEPEGAAICAALEALMIPYQIVPWQRARDTVFTWQQEPVDIIGTLGTIGFTQSFHRSYQGPELYPFFTTQVQYYSRYQHLLPADALLNSRGYLLPFGEIRRRPPADVVGLFGGDSVFMRPDCALKLREAERVDSTGLINWVRYGERVARTDDHELFWLFEPRPISTEIRYIVCAGNVVAASQYMLGDKISHCARVSEQATAFARSLARAIDLCDPVYVLDLALSEGCWKAIEINAFSTSGLYLCDKMSTMAHASCALRDIARQWRE